MRQQADELDELGVQVGVVTFQADFMARAYAHETELTWPLLVDGDRSLYQAYDMLHASWWDVWGPKTWLAYARELLGGAKLVHSEADVSQRGGDVLVDPTGIVRLHHVGDGPADRPSVTQLLDTIRASSAAEVSPHAATTLTSA